MRSSNSVAQESNAGDTRSVAKYKAVIFDYGNTLAQCAEPQMAYQDDQLARLLRDLFGSFDEADFLAQRHHDRRAPYFNGYRENDIPSISRELVQALFNRAPDASELKQIVDLQFTSFVASIRATKSCEKVLTALAKAHRLAVVSNYPCGRTIRASLDANELTQYFEAVVVSGDLGYVKPHPAPFLKMLETLAIEPDRAVYVGDNWLADIRGAKGLGMAAIHTHQWDTPEKFEPQENDPVPDHTIGDLRELLALSL